MALWLPRLPTDRIIRNTGSPEAPLVISGRQGNALVVMALDARAERLGLSRHMPLANARAMVQPLCVIGADDRADATLLEATANWCDRFTPLVGLDPPDGLFLDITGAAHLFGGETAMLKTVLSRITAQGLTVRGAIAGTSLAAHALARYAPGRIVPVGEDRGTVADLPTTALDPGEKALRALRHAGLKTIGMVAARLSSELAERLGRDFVRRLQVTLGMEENPIAPRRPLPDLMAEQRFADPVISQDMIAVVLLALAGSLCRVLERGGRGARVLEAAFFRADGKVIRIAVRSGEPLRDPKIMLRLLQQKMDALADPLDPGFGFDLIRLEALLAEETQPATLSFDASENARMQVARLLDRLSARFGEARVQRFVARDTHIPEAAGVAVPALDHDFDGTWRRTSVAGDPPRRPLRLLRKPESIKDSFDVAPDGAPRFFEWRQCRHQIVRAEGPERIALEWWEEKLGDRIKLTDKKEQEIERCELERPMRPSRDYFRVETNAGQRFWIYRDGTYHWDNLKPRWFLHGIFA
jgi:protein ImuB